MVTNVYIGRVGWNSFSKIINCLNLEAKGTKLSQTFPRQKYPRQKYPHILSTTPHYERCKDIEKHSVLIAQCI